MTLFIALLIGFILALFTPNFAFMDIPGHQILLYALLAVGLYGSVYGIALDEFNKHKSLIIRAVTLGVMLKSLIIGSLFWLIFQNLYAFLFGIILAQIDPLSVAHLIDNKSNKFSASGRTILRAWSSFDDPMTVLLALYLFLPIVILTGADISIGGYFTQLAINLAFALLVFLLSRIASTNTAKLVLLAATFAFAVPLQLMLAIALSGIFLRPAITHLARAVQIAFVISAVLLGSLIRFEISLVLYGIVLGFLAYFSQIIVTYIVAPTLRQNDKLYLSFAQYNGITAIILALVIAQWVPQTVSIIAAAIVTINVLYHISNYKLEKYIARQSSL